MNKVQPAILGAVALATLVITGCGSNSTSGSANVTATPTFSPGGGAYNTSQAVTIADSTSGAVLYCTTDGTTPTASSPVCAQPTTVFKSQFLQAIAVAPGKAASAVAAAAYTIDLTAAATPTFSPAGGTYATAQQVTIADATSGANIYYTTDGSVPTASSTLYTGPVSVSNTETLSAIAVASGYSNSGIASAAYSISQSVAAPTFSVPTGNYTTTQTVTIADATANAAIFYTVDGSVPTASSTAYTGPITVSQTEVINAIAVANGNTSAVATAAYTIGVSGPVTVPAPAFTPVSGSTVSAGQAILIVDGDANATIYYTIDGTQPTTSSSTYTSAGVVLATSGTTTVNAIAVDSGVTSTVATATYTVTPPPVPAPTFSPASGATLSSGQTVTLADSDANATLYYTLDGSVPSATSTKYTAPITLSTVGSTTINAIAVDTTSSAVSTATYTIAPANVPAPTFSPASGSVAQGQVVNIVDGDANAVIYYTTDGTVPTASSTRYTSAGVTLSTTGSASIKAIAIDTGVASAVATASYTVTATSVTPPVFAPGSGTTVPVGQTVTITETDAKAKIYYTLNGSTPTASSTLYSSGGFTLTTSGSITVKAIAIDGSNSSAVVTATYSVAPTSVPAPTFSPASGATLTAGQTVTIADGDTNATIYYTLDGSAPSASSSKYTAAIPLTASGTVKAIAIDTGVSSTVANATYTVTVPAPTFSPASGTTLTAGQTVAVADSDTHASIYYTLDGSPPSASSTKYTAAIALTASATVKAIAIDTGVSSAVSTATYTVPVSVPAPTFSPASGASVTTGQTVTIADSDTNAAIYYTLNGSTPSASSTKYTAPVALSSAGTVTIKAIAIDAGNDSAVSTATYTVTTPSGPTISGKVLSGTAAVNGATVQLYTAGKTGYGVAPAPLGAAVTTSSTGAFAATFSSCPASPGDLVYAVATGGDTGHGANTDLALMTALGPCSQVSTSTTYIVNEVTTVASAYALSPFMTTAPNVGSSSTNYQGLKNAFATVNNLVDVTTGTALSITPAYKTNPVPYLNSSTAPQKRVNTLANILNACVNSDGGAACTNLFSDAKPTGGTTPATTLQAILDIAQNPGEKVSSLFGTATTAFAPALTAAPNDFTLALTFTGGGLGIDPAVTDGTLTYGGTSFTGIGPTQNAALAIDATGDVWVSAGGYDYSFAESSVPFLAEFNNLGAPLTPATTVSAANPPAVTYGGFNPEPGNQASLGALAIDQVGKVWVADLTSTGSLFEVAPNLSVSTTDTIGDQVTSLAIDANDDEWAFATNSTLNTVHNGTVTTLAPPNGAQYAGQLNNLTFDANGGLWGSDVLSPSSSSGDIYQMNLTTGGVSFDAFPSGGSYSTTAADSAGNIYGCGDPGGQTLDVFKAGAEVTSHAITTGRGCGSQLLIDGAGHIFAVSDGFSFPSGMAIDEFTTTGALISPATNGYTGTSSAEPVTINNDPNYFGDAPSGTYLSGTAAIDGSGNLWVLNPDTNGATPGNVLVEFVGIAAPVITPTSLALQNGVGVRP